MLEKLLIVGKFSPEGSGESQGKDTLIDVPFEEILLSLLTQGEGRKTEGFQSRNPDDSKILPAVIPDVKKNLIQEKTRPFPPPFHQLPQEPPGVIEGKLHSNPVLNVHLTGQTQLENDATSRRKITTGIQETNQLLPEGNLQPQKSPEYLASGRLTTLIIKDVKAQNHHMVENPKSEPSIKTDTPVIEGSIPEQEKNNLRAYVMLSEKEPAGDETVKRSHPGKVQVNDPDKFIENQIVEEREGVNSFLKDRVQRPMSENQIQERVLNTEKPLAKKVHTARSELHSTTGTTPVNLRSEMHTESAQGTEQVMKKELPQIPAKGEVKSVNIKFEDTQFNFRFNTVHSNLSVEVKAKNALENYISFLDAGRLQKTLSMLGVGLESIRINGNELIGRSFRTVRRDVRERDIIDRNEGISEKADSRPFNNSGLNLFL